MVPVLAAIVPAGVDVNGTKASFRRSQINAALEMHRI